MNSHIWPIDARLRHWHPVALVSRITTKPLAVQCCGVAIVLFADRDRGVGCPVRSLPAQAHAAVAWRSGT
jgi:hypothetical protein